MKKSALATSGLAAFPFISKAASFQSSYNSSALKGKRVGIIGLDTSHSIAFAKGMNKEDANPKLLGYKVVAAYPHGSKDIVSSTERIPGYIDQMKEIGVEIVDSIASLLDKTDVILLETNDGRRHLEQVIPVLQAGKRVFIDKPIAASLEDTYKIFEASEKYNIPVWSSSSLRYTGGMDKLKNGEIGKVLGATTFSPAKYEETHPDLYWYAIHGVETLFTVMGTGCQSVSRTHTEGLDVVTGIWEGGRIGTFTGLRSPKGGYGGTAFGEKGQLNLGPYGGYMPLLEEVASYFDTGIVPVRPEETIEICAFMTAADLSKKKNGKHVSMEKVMNKAQ
ncbi:Gfo/Idh/MocA family oxidoreductase [Membranihabitans marinus]